MLIPIAGLGTSNNIEYDNNSLVIPSKNKLSYYDIKRLFKVPVAPYIKITAEYAFKPYKMDNAEMDFVLGAYLSYNFGMQYDVSILNEYTPQQIKIALTGMGKADKSQVQFMVKTIIGLEKTPRPDDAADALAVAICHSQTNQAMRGL